MNEGNEIDLRTWERREAYAYFSRMSDPFYMVTFRQDVTGLYNYTRARGLSFYEGMIWACTRAINSVDAFLVTSGAGGLRHIDRRDPSFTDLRPGREQFNIVTLEYRRGIEAFCREASRARAAQETFIDPEKESDSLIYYSCLPWIELTALTQERDLSAPGALEDSIPRLAWGKYVPENGRRSLCISMEVNHRYIDGIHIGKFAECLSALIEAPEQ